MNDWLERKARRMLVAGALAFAVGAPTIACMGGETGSEEGGGGGDAGEFDAEKAMIGTWKVKPHQDEIRELKVVDMALRPKSNVEMLKKKLQPPPTAEEIQLFEEVKRRGPKDPEVQFLKSIMDMMKGATLTVTSNKWTYAIGEEKFDMNYSVDSKDGKVMKVTLTNAPGGTEKHTLTFTNDNEIDVLITAPKEQRLVFVRK